MDDLACYCIGFSTILDTYIKFSNTPLSMSWIDWLVLFGTLLLIVLYGIIRSSGSRNLGDYFLGNYSLKWWHVGISVMATQASAITFISTPGQAYEDGMRFIQFYLGLPLSMILISAFFIPVYNRLRVYTAYEYLENRFNQTVRQFTALLFLTQRGLASGITIFAPSIILSSILGWDLHITNISIGLLVIAYTVTGGAKAVSITQRQQMAVMMGGMMIAILLLLWQISKHINPLQAIEAAGAAGKLNFISWDFNLSSRYSVWTGLIGGLFLSLSYFGTDQSQVGRYLGGRSLNEIRLGLLFNGIFKIPMQLFILFAGILVFIFFNLHPSPLLFNQPAYHNAKNTLQINTELSRLTEDHKTLIEERRAAFIQMAKQPQDMSVRYKWNNIEKKVNEIHDETLSLIKKHNPNAAKTDTDYVFVYYIMNYLPIGLVGLLFAVIFSAAMSSIAAELNALASTTLIDFYKRSFKPQASDKHYVHTSKIITFIWGIIAILFATILSLFDNLIEAVNIIGSLFYGTILGVFLVGFFFNKISSKAVLTAAILSQISVLIFHWATVLGWIKLAYLWYNLVGCLMVCILSLLFHIAGLRDKAISS